MASWDQVAAYTRVNLVQRKIFTEDVCPDCKAQPEDTMHALWSCPVLQDMWKVQFSKLMSDTGTCSNFLEILKHALTEKSSFDLLAMTISVVWQRRNKVRVGETVLPLSQPPAKAYDALQEFQQLRPTRTEIPRTARDVKWRLLSAPCVKANFDSTLFSQDGLAGIGVIIGLGQLGLQVKWVADQNGSFLNGSIRSRIESGQVDPYFSNFLVYFLKYMQSVNCL